MIRRTISLFFLILISLPAIAAGNDKIIIQYKGTYLGLYEAAQKKLIEIIQHDQEKRGQVST